MLKTSTALIALVALAGAAAAQTTYNSALGIAFTPGVGNSNTNFAINRTTETSGNVIELGVKAKERFFGDANVGGSGALYIVKNGFSPVSGGNPAPDAPRAWWNFDFSVNLGSRSLANTTVSFNVLSNVTNQSFNGTFNSALPSNLSIIQGSENLGFSYLLTPLNFNAWDVGTYNFTFTATDTSSGAALGQIAMTVQVVPLPGAAFAGFAGLTGLTMIRRRTA